MELTLRELLEGTGGVLRYPLKDKEDMILSNINTDTRCITKGDVFFALSGANFDGHDYVCDATEKGASVVVVKEGVSTTEEDASKNKVAFVEVSDTLQALGDLAAFVRKRSKKPTIAISGSTGKSTTKEMCAAILSQGRRVLKTEGNKNNLIGVPLTIFNLDAKDEVLVLELGISEVGEMRRLTEIASPDVSVLTNVGHGHLHGLGSIEGVAREKGEIFRGADVDLTRVVNLDDERVRELSDMCKGGSVISFGRNEAADVRIKNFTRKGLNNIEAEYVVNGKELLINLKTSFEVNVYNAAAAMAAALALDVSTDDMKNGLQEYQALKGRMELLDVEGVTLIDDTYNANPDSAEAALRALMSIEVKGKRIAVFGEMLELGTDEEKFHKDLGLIAASLGIDVLLGVGRLGTLIADGADTEDGQIETHRFDTNDEALAWLMDNIGQGDAVLVKGSRGAGTEVIVKGFISRGRGSN